MSDEWITRSAIQSGDNAAVFFHGDPAQQSVGLTQADIDTLRGSSVATLQGIRSKLGRRAVVSTLQQGLFPIGLSAEVFGALDIAVGYASPRGRLRLLKTIKTLQPDTWVTTPCAALDFLARLYMEFNVDPFELGLEHIVLTGEIASPGAQKRIADEFEAVVTDVYTDPVFGAALAWREGNALHCPSQSLALAERDADTIIAQGEQLQASTAAEIVLHNSSVSALAGKVLRSGQLIDCEQNHNSFHHSCGELVMVRGQWLSLPAFHQAFKLIDGIQGWQLVIERGEGTLDKVTPRIGLNRETLVENPMWQGRLRETIASVSAVEVHVDTYLLTEDEPQPDSCIDDQRGHHLGKWLP